MDSSRDDKEEKKEHKGEIPEAPPLPVEEKSQPEIKAHVYDDDLVLPPMPVLSVQESKSATRDKFVEILENIAPQVAQKIYEEKLKKEYEDRFGHHLKHLREQGKISSETYAEIEKGIKIEIKEGKGEVQQKALKEDLSSYPKYETIYFDVRQRIASLMDKYIRVGFGELERGKSIHKNLANFSVEFANSIGGSFAVQSLNDFLKLAEQNQTDSANILVLNTFIDTFERGKKNGYDEKMSVWLASVATQLVSYSKTMEWSDDLAKILSDNIIQILTTEFKSTIHKENSEENRKGPRIFDQKDVKETKEVNTHDLIYNQVHKFVQTNFKNANPDTIATAINNIVDDFRKELQQQAEQQAESLLRLWR